MLISSKNTYIFKISSLKLLILIKTMKLAFIIINNPLLQNSNSILTYISHTYVSIQVLFFPQIKFKLQQTKK